MRGDWSLAHHYIDAAAAIDPKYPQLIQVRDQLKKQEASAGSSFGFHNEWALPELQLKQS